MSGLETIAMIAGLVGTGIQTLGTIQAGREAEARFQYESKVAQQQADEAQAAAQRDAAARRREGQFLLSRQRAAIAGSGGSLEDASVIKLMGDTAGEVDLAAQTDMYRGEQQAKGYNDAARVAEINAKNAMNAAYLSAGANMFSGVSNMYARFGQQARQTATAANAPRPLYR